MYILFSDEYSPKYCLAFEDEEFAREWAKAQNLNKFVIRFVIATVTKKSELN